jgi:ribonuclease Y
MPEIAIIFIWGLGLAGIITACIYLFWLRPSIERVKRHVEKEAELKSGAAILEAKEESIRQRERLEAEFREKQTALTKMEDRLCAKEETLDLRRSQIDERESAIQATLASFSTRESSLQSQIAEVESELQRVAKLTENEAREIVIARISEEVEQSAAQLAKQIEIDAAADAHREAKKVVLDVIQRSVVDYVTEATLAVVELPSEDMKGRIIGREGRNIRAFEQVTGVDLIIDETPEAVVISCFDPVRRETARLALMNLMVDGRIHPGRIEELYEKAQEEVERMIRDAGERAADRANVPGLHPKSIEVLGRLRFRTSYAQNVLDHSVEVSRLAGNLASELGLNVEVAKRAGLLHDIGKALGPEWEGPHAITGMEFLRGLGEKDAILNPVGAHHHEIEPETAEAQLVIIADTISAARPGARRENLENYIKRLASLEQLANSFEGVDRSFALQAGREIRVIVKPDQIDDLAAMRLANEMAKRIEAEMEYPGQIKVTVIRETRATNIAK